MNRKNNDPSVPFNISPCHAEYFNVLHFSRQSEALSCKQVFSNRVENSVDPDQMQPDLDLKGLLNKLDKSRFSSRRVNNEPSISHLKPLLGDERPEISDP